jgi:multidrug efflux pump subunit AcrA (membrane-fusion protein)
MGDDKALSTHTLRSGSPVVLLLRVGKPTSRLTVPRSAVEEINTRTYVFVQVGGEQFEKRRVVLGDADGDYVHVLEGVAVGERVVTRGGYDIHLASVIGSVESHRH